MKQFLCIALAAMLAIMSAGVVAAPPADRGAERTRVYVAYHADSRGPASRSFSVGKRA